MMTVSKVLDYGGRKCLKSLYLKPDFFATVKTIAYISLVVTCFLCQ